MSAFRIYETDTCVPRGPTPGPGPGPGPDPDFDWSPPDAGDFAGGIVRLSGDGKLAAVAYTASASGPVLVQSYEYDDNTDSWSKRGGFLDPLSELEAKLPATITIFNDPDRYEGMTFDMDDGGDKIVLGFPQLKFSITPIIGAPSVVTPEVGTVLAFKFNTSAWGGIQSFSDAVAATDILAGRAVSISGDGNTVAFSVDNKVKLYDFDTWAAKGTQPDPVPGPVTSFFVKLLMSYNGSVVLGLVPGTTNAVYRSDYSLGGVWSPFSSIVPSIPGNYVDITANSTCDVLGAFRSGPLQFSQSIASCWIKDNSTGDYIEQGNPITNNLSAISKVSLNGDGSRFVIGTETGTDVYELSVIDNAISEVLNGSSITLVEWNKLGTNILGPGNASVDISTDGGSLAVWEAGSDVSSTYKYVEQQPMP